MNSIEKLTANILIELGIAPSLLGYRYLKTAIPMVYYNRDYLDRKMKLLYKDVAKEYNSNSSKVDKTIRHAIDFALTNTKQEVINKYFGNIVSSGNGRVTNSIFIATIVERISLDYFEDGCIREAENYAKS